MEINHEEIVQLTQEHGGAWGINHTRRLLQLVSVIGEGKAYDHEAIWLTAHLHDWGAYAGWAQSGVDHVLRSLQVVEPFLDERNCPASLKETVLDCIKNHHSDSHQLGLEATLFRDADVVDFLGVVGVMRDFSKNFKEMRKAYLICRERQEKLPASLVMPKAREMAIKRVAEMDELLERFEQDSWGHF